MTDTVEPTTAPAGPGDDRGANEKAGEKAPEKERRGRFSLPQWWHKDHPVFGPLAGFYTGMLFVIVVPGLYGTLLKSVVGYQRTEELFPFVALTLLVPIGLLVPRRTRRFGRYMLFGCLATAVVVIGVAAVVLYLLITRDS
ncbi:hypothetical protein [Nocardioides sp. YIM 152588]|uniref:hypothetical protein n=1 Tax=Nocardioides sp. YIM 152588 TaxID=3158259 RepID=UPI0032E41E62